MARINIKVDKDHIRHEYDSVEDLANAAKPYITDRYPMGMREELADSDYYGDTGTPGAAFVMAREGWDAHLQSTLDIAHDAVTDVEQEHDTLTFQPSWNVSGGMVDMGAYLAGEPECMIEFPPAKTSKVGRVITLCASISVSCFVSADELIKKGQLITALALELERMGMNVELIADQTVTGYSKQGTKHMTQRVTVKGPNDVLDPAKILFAYAHPAMLRVIALTAYHQMPEQWKRWMGVYGGYGSPAKPPRDLPDGTIYLPETLSSGEGDRPPADILKDYLKELGLI